MKKVFMVFLRHKEMNKKNKTKEYKNETRMKQIKKYVGEADK